ncbi:MAG: hypothetical protein A2083_05430 [Gemmatimonadetes bacterium GWC2_71_9]|nr:MAG: hypothetical protein A2083_05430 [Gemmatimonadetes bacterium GWC2_71_9]OGT97321.1 MAG: hypothetical protein A3I79_07515 [Gemmatimonadetes bacterium RIFCSPLOWO2_02_FULL_71_11]
MDRAPPSRAAAQGRAQRINRLRDSVLAQMANSGGIGDTVIAVRAPAAEGGRPAELTSAAGHAQGVALEVGSGRVVILGEAAFLSAQIVAIPGSPTIPVGMNVPGPDNQQFALNLLHWLTRLLN